MELQKGKGAAAAAASGAAGGGGGAGAGAPGGGRLLLSTSLDAKDELEERNRYLKNSTKPPIHWQRPRAPGGQPLAGTGLEHVRLPSLG